MRKLSLLLLLISLTACSSRLSTAPVNSRQIAPATVPAGTWLLTPGNTRITFVGTALVISHEGMFTRFDGQITGAESQPQNAKISIAIDMDSVYTEIPLLTKHLKADDFFDVVNYPKATFVSTSISTSSNVAPGYVVTGNLTLHGITKSITFPARLEIDSAQFRLDATIIVRQSDFKMASARTTTNEVPVNVTVRISRPPKAGL